MLYFIYFLYLSSLGSWRRKTPKKKKIKYNMLYFIYFLYLSSLESWRMQMRIRRIDRFFFCGSSVTNTKVEGRRIDRFFAVMNVLRYSMGLGSWRKSGNWLFRKISFHEVSLRVMEVLSHVQLESWRKSRGIKLYFYIRFLLRRLDASPFT